MKFFIYTVIVIVAASIIVGFFVLGTPKEERLRRLDETRVSDLQNLQWQVTNYWQAKGSLPADLGSLINETSGTRPPTDPETGASYEYKVTNQESLAFELCATFKTQTPPGLEDPVKTNSGYGPESANWNWRHAADRTCFSRTIDPDLYPPLEKSR